MSIRPTDRVLVQLPGGVAGPFLVSRLRQVKGFTLQTLVSFPGSEKWAPAFRVLPLKSYFDGPLEITSDTHPGVPPPLFTLLTPRARMIVPPVFFGKVQKERHWVDRWLPRVVLINLLFFAAIYAGWTYQPWRKFLQQSFTDFMAPTWGTSAPTLLAESLPDMPLPARKIFRPASVIHAALFSLTPSRIATPKHHPHSLT